jgi:hypothetical protein
MRGGVGLANTRARLEALYGDDHRLSLGRVDGGGCEVRIELPFRSGAGAGRSLPAPDETVPEAALPEAISARSIP